MQVKGSSEQVREVSRGVVDRSDSPSQPCDPAGPIAPIRDIRAGPHPLQSWLKAEQAEW